MQSIKQLVELFKTNRFFRVAVIFGSLFLVLVLVLAPKKSPSPLPAPSSVPRAVDTRGRTELTNLPEEKLTQASSYRQLVSDRLPIYIENIHTSPGIETAVNIYYLPSDPASVVRFEVYGLSYAVPDSTPLGNPNMLAFQESFTRGLDALKKGGMDPKQFIFIYGDTEYVRVTAESWVDKLGLLK